MTERLSEIKCPTLIVVGEDDLIKGRSHSERMLKGIPHAEYIIIPGGAHAICIDSFAPLNTMLIGFVLKHSQAGNIN